MGYDHSDDSDYERKKKKKSKKQKKEKVKKERHVSDDEEMDYDADVKEEPDSGVKLEIKQSGSDWDDAPKKKTPKKKVKKSSRKSAPRVKEEVESPQGKKRKSEVNGTVKKEPKVKRVKKEKEPSPEKWEWWKESAEDRAKREAAGIKWKTLEHMGPYFPDDYIPLPKSVRMMYKDKPYPLKPASEEVMQFYAAMLNTDYVTDPKKSEMFSANFFKDWRLTMTDKEKSDIKSLDECNFRPVLEYIEEKREERKSRTKEEKTEEKEKNAKIADEYGFCLWDGHKEKIGNFRLEPPGLFRGRGEHPKMGRVKQRIKASDIIINCSKGSKIPQPPAGQKWKEVRHDNKVTWLACWIENVQGGYKYTMLGANSRIKGEKDWMKYEKARELKKHIQKIRADYEKDLESKMMYDRQRAVAMFFIDRLALRAGNEKDTDEAADTVGCCSLRVEHVKVHKDHMIDGKAEDYVVEFDFLGKDSMRYHNFLPVSKRVYKNIKIFMENKNGSDDLFDRLDTSKLNKHLQSLMEGLTAKVFRTYNASITLQQQLNQTTENDRSIAEQVLTYNQANRAVAILCNHRKTASKNFDDQMGRMDEKLNKKRQDIEDKEAQLDCASKKDRDKLQTQLTRLKDQLTKLECARQDKDENKEIALGTSKLNYLDPRITIGWCKKFDVPVDKVYNKTQRDKFAWAIAMADEEFQF